MELIAVATDLNGRRVELVLRLPDEYQGEAMSTNEAESRLRLMLQTGVTRAAEIVSVSEKDMLSRRKFSGMKRSPSAGPDQIAAAGSKSPAVVIPTTGATQAVRKAEKRRG
jgi:hypothetical protein